MTSDFRSKHTLLMLHIWMVHKRLQAEGERGERVQEALFDELWDDTCNRIRGQGINELSVSIFSPSDSKLCSNVNLILDLTPLITT